MTTRAKLVGDLMRGDVIRTPDSMLDPMGETSEHTVVEAITIDGEFCVQVEPNPFGEHWKLDPRQSIFVLRENADVEQERTVTTDAVDPPMPVLLGGTEITDPPSDDPLVVLTRARTKLRTLGFVLGAVRGGKLRAGDVLMVNGAGDMRRVEERGRDTRSGVHVKLEGAGDVTLQISQPFLCLRPVKV